MTTIYGERWVTKKPLREGGQAHTFLVTDAKGSTDQQYVLKRLKNPVRLGRFKSEISAIRDLSHENILKLVDFDLEAEKPYLVTEYCAGGSLEDADKYWLDSPLKALSIFRDICSGLLYAHGRGIIHRDIKPGNIFLRGATGPAVIGDFGLCLLECDTERVTLSDEAVGSRLYMAPELEDGRIDTVAPEVDIYSLGKLLYWLLSGGRLFSREKHRDIKNDLKGQNDDKVLGWNNIYLEHVNRLLDRMIVADPTERYKIYQVEILAKRITRLIEREFNPVSDSIRQSCTYCGIGYYRIAVSGNPTDVRNFGFSAVGMSDWKILVCNECGHVQSFRLDLAAKDQSWK